MTDESKGPSTLLVLVLMSIVFMIACAIAYGIISQYFHQ